MIRINQLKLKHNHTESVMVTAIAKLLHIKPEFVLEYNIVKRSIDSRKKPDIYYVYSVDVKVENEGKILKKINNNNIMLSNPVKYTFPKKKIVNYQSPVIVGMGPAGLFCGLMLALNGVKPIIIERGESVDDRIKTVDDFWKNNKLNVNSNVQFGEGGAGTFSDGKLNTMVKDPSGRIKYVLEKFVEYGASPEITYVNKPHIGTDVLCTIVKNIRNEIIRLGGKIMFNTCLTDIEIKEGKITGITVNNDTYMSVNNLVLAIGHSARDTFEMLYKKQLSMSPKSFAVGIRIIHPQRIINDYSYGIDSTNLPESLPVADYKVVHQCKSGRGVYSFCMCPGGYVVNASSEEDKLAINGMSYSDRASESANSALIVTVNPDDYNGDSPLSGVYFQRELESRAFTLGKGSIPVQLYEDYKNGTASSEFGDVTPCIKGKTTFADINEIFPDFINDSIKEGIESFANQIKGFDMPDAIILGVESRTSSPIRIHRNDTDYMSNIEGIYPCGEGCGYAGGITSACVDGIRTAEKLYQHL